MPPFLVDNRGPVMVFSMTGYGRAESGSRAGRLVVEVRSVNNRYLDIQVKMPRSLLALEQRVRKAVQERFGRGRFDVFITLNGDEGRTAQVVLDADLAGQYVAAFRELKERFGLQGDMDLSLLAGRPDIIVRDEGREDPESLWTTVRESLVIAMNGLQGMRTAEGAALAADMTARLGRIEQVAAAIQEQSPRIVGHARDRMAEAVKRLTGEQLDPARLAQEIALLAERTDVTEELTRLRSHLTQFRNMIERSGGDAVGRKLDFLLQEMMREANTVASKAMDADIARHVVDIKAELEKIREQAQNIE